MRSTLKATRVPIARSRPDVDGHPVAEARGISNPGAHEPCHPVVPNPHRGPWNTALLDWPVVTGVRLVVVLRPVGHAGRRRVTPGAGVAGFEGRSQHLGGEA